MSRDNRKSDKAIEEDSRSENGRTSNNRKSSNKGRRGKGRKPNNSKPKLDTDRSNNPAWYYADAALAEQVSQMAFQNLAGLPINYDGFDIDVPNIVRIHLNPSPGVQTSSRYNTALAQNSAMNLAAFRLYSKLSAFTGRTQSYAPQDVAMMILAWGDVISATEFIRRAFGVAFTMNMRNRDYPAHVLEFGMCIDPDDLFAHYSDYRTQFNTLITLINQMPIPKNVAYFDKCAAIYEKIYLDSPSAMAQTLVSVPEALWLLDEQSYSGGSILSTTPFVGDQKIPNATPTIKTMAYYLNRLSTMIGALLNSSSLQIVYTDILNLATKMSVDFWRMDYLMEGYTVMPEYDLNFLLQMHNATLCDAPQEPTFVTSPVAVTPYNDVYPDPNTNSIYYNPAFASVANNSGIARTGNCVLIDMLTDQPTLTDRVEVTRYASICNGTAYTTTTNLNCFIDTALPDHYIVRVYFETQTSNLTYSSTSSTIMNTSANYRDVAALVANIDWAPRFFEVDNNGYTGRYTGDVNFYTVVDGQYIRKLHDFCGLALYDVR